MSPEPDFNDLHGRVAVVTGGAFGVGRGLVEALLGEGARLSSPISRSR